MCGCIAPDRLWAMAGPWARGAGCEPHCPGSAGSSAARGATWTVGLRFTLTDVFQQQGAAGWEGLAVPVQQAIGVQVQ